MPQPALQAQGQGQGQPRVGQSKLLTNSLADQYAKTGSFPVFIFQSNLKITYGILKAAPLLSSQPSPINWVSAFFPIPDAQTGPSPHPFLLWFLPGSFRGQGCPGFCVARGTVSKGRPSAEPLLHLRLEVGLVRQTKQPWRH